MKNADQLISKLKGLYLPKHRYVNFGDVLLSMQTYGIRGMSASVIRIWNIHMQLHQMHKELSSYLFLLQMEIHFVMPEKM